MEKVKACAGACPDRALAPLLISACQAALQAGRIIRERYEEPHRITRKGEIDLVTEADVAAEQAILTVLGEAHPEGGFLAEESGSSPELDSGQPVWIIDPLDGTTNFAHGFPWFCTSIAYFRNGRSELGVIYHPLLDELFCCCRGGGAWLNGRRLWVSAAQELQAALLATGFPYDVHQHPEAIIAPLRALLTRARGVRRAGAAALDLAYVACGRLDGFWEIKLKPWDSAAGQLLVEEAGGKITDFSGGPYSPFLPELLASNGALHEELTTVLKKFSIRD